MRPTRLLSTLLVVCAFSPAASAEESSTAPTLVRGEGARIRMHRLLPWRSVADGGAVRVGAELSCPEGCSVRLGDGTVATLDPGAVASAREATFVLRDPTIPARRAERIDLSSGVVRIDRPRSAERPFVVADDGGAFVAIASGSARITAVAGRTLVTTIDGSTAVKSRATWVDVAAGEAATVHAGLPPAAPRPAARAPRWTVSNAALGEPQPIALSFEGFSAEVGSAWTEPHAARSVRIEVALDPAFRQIVHTLPDTRRSGTFAVELTPGSYFARLRAIDADGFASEPSATRPLRVMRVGLGRGAFASRSPRTVVVPAGRGFELLDAAGLRSAVDKSAFTPAAPYTQHGDATHLLRLRFDDDPSTESTFRVQPRALRADVRFSPALPEWPTDPIDVTVDLHDPTGQTDLATILPKMTVLVGVDEAPLVWKRAPGGGDGRQTWQTRVPARPTTQPTVVRVAIADDAGGELGRAFVEVGVCRGAACGPRQEIKAR